MQRIAILVEKNLGRGEMANVAAILMGQAALCSRDIYHQDPVLDTDGIRHAGIQYSTVVLKAGAGQLANLVRSVRSQHPDLTCVVFSRTGQGLHNRFEEYQASVQASDIEQLEAVGVLLSGSDEEVRVATKKFSLLK